MSTTLELSDADKKAKKKAYQAEWYQKNRGHVLEKASKWQKDHPDRVNQKNRKWKRGNPETTERKRDRWLRTSYGIDLADRDQLLADQGGLCAICCTDTPPKKGWFVDHCHASGVVRGLLCLHCNAMLGMSRDNPAVLAAGIKYLKAHQNGYQAKEEAV